VGQAVEEVENKTKGEASVAAVLSQLVMVLTSLVLQTSSELREISGFTFIVFLLGLDKEPVQEAIESVNQHNEEVQERREKMNEAAKQKEAGQEPEAIPKLAAPHLQAAMRFLMSLGKQQCLRAGTKEKLTVWWEEKVEGKTSEQVPLEIRSFRGKKPQIFHKKHVAKQFAKVTFKIASQSGEEALVAAMSELGGEESWHSTERDLGARGDQAARHVQEEGQVERAGATGAEVEHFAKLEAELEAKGAEVERLL